MQSPSEIHRSNKVKRHTPSTRKRRCKVIVLLAVMGVTLCGLYSLRHHLHGDMEGARIVRSGRLDGLHCRVLAQRHVTIVLQPDEAGDAVNILADLLQSKANATSEIAFGYPGTKLYYYHRAEDGVRPDSGFTIHTFGESGVELYDEETQQEKYFEDRSLVRRIERFVTSLPDTQWR